MKMEVGDARESSAAAPRAPAPDINPQSLTPEIVARLVAGWRVLCEDERDSVIAATLVAGNLARLGAPSSILAGAARVIEDEIRHVGVCATVLERLGAEVAEVPAENRRRGIGDNPWPSSAGRRWPWWQASGVGESMSAGCFAAARRGCRQPLVRWALTELLRDEARHGAFGIDTGRWVTRNWSEAERRALLGRMRRRDGSVRTAPRGARLDERSVDAQSRGIGRRHPERA